MLVTIKSKMHDSKGAYVTVETSVDQPITSVTTSDNTGPLTIGLLGDASITMSRGEAASVAAHILRALGIASRVHSELKQGTKEPAATEATTEAPAEPTLITALSPLAPVEAYRSRYLIEVQVDAQAKGAFVADAVNHSFTQSPYLSSHDITVYKVARHD